MITIILVEPITPGNIGAVARVMKNFGFEKLVLVNPKCNHLSQEAIDRASHAKDVIKNAIVVKKIPKMDYLVATTGKLGTDFNLKRSPLSPKELSDKVKSFRKVSIGLVFGREDSGLTNEEILKCDFTVTINTKKKYPVMNLSHAVAIILYELCENNNNNKINNITPIGLKEKEELQKLIFKTLDSMQFSDAHKKETQKMLWKRIIGKSMLTKREFMALMGYFRKIN